jgi:outer membrane receptor protein involved in Fe transport
LDRWTNGAGFSNRIPVTGSASLIGFIDRAETAFSPRVSVSRRFDSGVSINASIYRAFRAPTLNELYRNFRVGNIVTNANADLRAERLSGGEAGINFRKFSERLHLRGNVFWSQVDDAVANVTLASTPALITRQRQNVGAIRARGFEAAAEMRLTSRLSLSTEYLLTDSTVRRFPANRSLEGLRVPQIPSYQWNSQISYERAKWNVGLQGRLVGEQFDDDQNLFPLKPFFTLDTQVSRVISPHLDFFVAVQNLTNTRYEIARSPVLNVGPPLIARVGVRIHLR